jgi:hypothetical protein
MRWSKHENKIIHTILGWYQMCLCKLLGWIVECNLWELTDIYPFSMLLFYNSSGWTYGSNGNKYISWTFGYEDSLWPWSLHHLLNIKFLSHLSPTHIHFLLLFVILSQLKYDLRISSLPLLSQICLFLLLPIYFHNWNMI